MRVTTSTRTSHSSAGESAARRVRRHNEWVMNKPPDTHFVNYESLAAERVAVKHHMGKITKDRIHGDPLGRKENNIARIAFENPNGLCPWNKEKAKPYRTARFMRRTNCDAYFGAEGNTNWDLVSYDKQFNNLFQNTRGVQSIAAHNVHDSSGRYQPGGTFGVAVDYLSTLVTDKGKDPTGLGRWCWMKVEGYGGHTTRIVTAYQP